MSYTLGVFLINEINIQATCSSSLLTGTAKTKGFDLAHVRLRTMNGDIEIPKYWMATLISMPMLK